jgi:hypothetical protein
MSRTRNYLIIAAVSLAAMMPMYLNGVPGGNDQPQHYQFAWTVYRSVSSGEVYPGFAAETNRGFGDVGLRFYPPLTYYVLAAGYFVTADWYYASLAAFTLVYFLGALGVYLWVRDEIGDEAALIAAGLYTFAPHHLNLIYTNALMAEFFASAVLPFCFLFLTRVIRSGGWLDVVGMTISYSLLVLTHLPTTIIGTIALALFTLVLVRVKGSAGVLVRLLAAGVLSAAMTSFYWLRMITELDWVKHSSEKYFSNTWDYKANFLLLPGHFTSAADQALNLWLADLMLIAMILLIVPAAVYLFRDATVRTKALTAAAAVAAFAVLMTTPVSAIIWDRISFLQKVQFPWRWLSVITLVGSFLGAFGVYRAGKQMRPDRGSALSLAIGAILVFYVLTDVLILKGPSFNSRQMINTEVAATPESTGCECWWPVWADGQALGQSDRVEADDRKIEIQDWGPTKRVFSIGEGTAQWVTAATFYYPHWHAAVNGTCVPVEHTTDGRISVPVPSGAADVELRFEEPQAVRIAYTVSLGAWAILFCFAAVLIFNKRHRHTA